MRPDPLFTDLYELTMMQSYLREGLTGEAVFSLFVRRLPRERNYLVACGLAGVLDLLETFRLSQRDLAFLESLRLFTDDFLSYLASFRFTGDVYAMPEGTVLFANEPILEVVAPLPEAQFFETVVMNQIHVQTLLASKASRVVTAAQGCKVVDFGARRMHGTEAANLAARAFHIAGVAATSNVAAGRIFGIPVAGTMAHSYIQAHDSECKAFAEFAASFPGTILLIDTYDTVEGAKRAIELAKKHGKVFNITGVRLDSGDLAHLSREVRGLLDAARLQHLQIIASGGLDEYEIARLIEAGAPIDGFGVGTAMGVSADVPALDIAYKLTEYDGQGRLKLSTAKATFPGRKQVFRLADDGRAKGDIIGRWGEALPGRPLLRSVMKDGRIVDDFFEGLDQIRGRKADSLAELPQHLLSPAPADPPYPADISPALQADTDSLRHRIEAQQRR